ncbi:MAG TPA: sigma factor-like helix-turn-helix DNA-binding protein [Syntrophomonadaceae bacterium]|nr:sigma factor-like helix-turn-helix DNA-binding protein [Syntrophomonadaceae bacterium]
MDGLEADLRETLYLRLINGYSIAETASTLGKSEADVYSAQYRALYALAHLLDQY